MPAEYKAIECNGATPGSVIYGEAPERRLDGVITEVLNKHAAEGWTVMHVEIVSSQWALVVLVKGEG